jgi:hypothetical protein
VLFLAPFSSAVVRRRTTLAVGTATCVVLAVAFSATVFIDVL